MKTLNLIQGSKEWNQHRKWPTRNASDAPNIMGVGYITRDQFIKQCATGIIEPVNSFTQKLFDDGHRFEALARPIAEKIIKAELYPCVGVDGLYSASFDGITIDDRIAWEHKTMNDEIRLCKKAEDLPLKIRIQMEQGFFVSKAEKYLFMASLWTERNELIEEIHFWYKSDKKLLKSILLVWDQTALDVQNYEHYVIKEQIKDTSVSSLPSVIIQVKGELTSCNLDDIRPYFDDFLSNAITELVTDEDFAKAEAESKVSREAAKRCLETAKSVLDQTLSISTVTKELESYAAKFNTMALRQEKSVKEQKELRKNAAKADVMRQYDLYINAINKGIYPVKININPPEWNEAMKHQKLMSSLIGKLNDALADGKIRANEVAKEIREKLSWYNEYVTATQFLFSDLQTIITGNSLEAFQVIVKNRISEYAIAQVKKDEEDRKRIQEEERHKIEAEQALRLNEELAKEREEERKKALAEKAIQDEKNRQELLAKQAKQREEYANNMQLRAEHLRQVQRERERIAEDRIKEETINTVTLDRYVYTNLVNDSKMLMKFYAEGIEDTDWYKEHKFKR